MLQQKEGPEVYVLDTDERREVRAGLKEIEQADIASAEEVVRVFEQLGLAI
jgi:hypothetical protein